MSIVSKERTKPHSTRLQKFGHYQRHLRRNPRRELVVDSAASMQMLSRKEVNSAGLDTVRISRNNTTVIVANGEVQTNEEATESVHDLELFVTVQILEDTPAALSLGKLCEDHGYSYEWASGRKPHLTTNDRTIQCNTGKLCTNRCSRIINRFLQLECKYISYTVA